MLRRGLFGKEKGSVEQRVGNKKRGVDMIKVFYIHI
jgi:hypothetical protein